MMTTPLPVNFPLSVAQYSVENRLRALTMNVSEINLMASKKDQLSTSKMDQSKVGKSFANGSINMR
jgi:hypothetical protein